MSKVIVIDDEPFIAGSVVRRNTVYHQALQSEDPS
jgi:hypothetical protein